MTLLIRFDVVDHNNNNSSTCSPPSPASSTLPLLPLSLLPPPPTFSPPLPTPLPTQLPHYHLETNQLDTTRAQTTINVVWAVGIFFASFFVNSQLTNYFTSVFRNYTTPNDGNDECQRETHATPQWPPNPLLPVQVGCEGVSIQARSTERDARRPQKGDTPQVSTQRALSMHHITLTHPYTPKTDDNNPNEHHGPATTTHGDE